MIEVTNLEDLCLLLDNNKHEEITITNPQGSIFYLGITYIEQMVAIAREKYPFSKFNFILNCEDDTSMVIEAMRMGFKKIRFCGNQVLYNKLLEIAAKTDSSIRIYKVD
jgi:hypothetical protein